MISRFFRQPLALIFSASLLGGIAVGIGPRLAEWARRGTGHGSADLEALGSASSSSSQNFSGDIRGEKIPAASLPPFSMEKFRASRGLAMHRMLAQVLPGADAALLRTLAEDLVKREPPTDNSPVWNAVMARWVRLDPQAALAWARTIDEAAKAAMPPEAPDPYDVQQLREQAREGTLLAPVTLRAWAGLNTEAAIAAAQEGNRAEWRAVLKVLSESDPGRALVLAGREGGPGNALVIDTSASSGDSLLTSWATKDPQACLAYIKAQNSEKHDKLLGKVSAGWALKDASACGEWMATLSPGEKDAAISGLSGAMAENPGGVSRILRSLPMDTNVRSAALRLVSAWSEKAPQEALAWVRERFPPGAQLACGLAAVASTVMRTNLPAAVAIMDEMGWQPWTFDQTTQTLLISPGKDGDLRSFEQHQRDFSDPFARGSIDPGDGIRALMERLGQEDPALAGRCFAKAPAESKTEMLAGLAPAWFHHAPEEAMAWLASLPEQQVSAEGMGSVLESMPELTPAAMRDWALRLPAGPLTEALAAKSIADTVVVDPATAMAQLPFNDPGSREAATKSILSQWAESAPQEAAENMIARPNPPADILSTALRNWTDRDPAAASAWTAALPPGAARDAAIGGLIGALSDTQRDPDLPSALAWSLDLSDPALRLKSAQELVSALSLSAPASTLPEIRETLNTFPSLSDADRAALLELIPP